MIIIDDTAWHSLPLLVLVEFVFNKNKPLYLHTFSGNPVIDFLDLLNTGTVEFGLCELSRLMD